MNTTIILLCTTALFVGALAHPPTECGQPPMKKPNECCQGIEKMVKVETFQKCDKECPNHDMCCKGNCFAREHGLLKGDKVDKETALSSLKAAVGDDKEWTDAITKATDECFNPDSQYRANFGGHGPRHSKENCTTADNGKVAFCIKRYMFKNCPKPVNDEECNKARNFMDCIDKHIEKHQQEKSE